jgi:PAS domain S-box-containing protein
MNFFRNNSFNIILPLFIVVIIFLVVISLFNQEKKNQTAQIVNNISLVLDNTHKTIKNVWLKELFINIESSIKDKEIHSLIIDMLNSKEIDREKLNKLRDLINSSFSRDYTRGFFVIDKNFINKASMRDNNIGVKNLILDSYEYKLKNVLKGKVELIPPIHSDVPLKNLDGKLEKEYPTMFVALPIYDGSKVEGIFTIRLDIASSLNEFTKNARLGRSGDLYLFDKNGYMITESRFTKDLIEAGVLNSNTSILNIKLINPQKNILKSKSNIDLSKKPYTYAYQNAISNKKGVSENSYRDYRGIKVYGAWIWDSELGIGFINEMDEDEVFDSFNFTKNIVTIGFVLFMAVTSIIFFVLNILRDKAQKDIEDSRQRLNAILQSSFEGIITVDVDRNILSFNSAAQKIFGYKESEIVGQKLDKLIHSLDIRQIYDVFEKRDNRLVEIKILTKDNKELMVEVGFNITKIGSDIFYTVTIHDISDRKEYEKSLLINQKILQEAQRIAKVGHWIWSKDSNTLICSLEFLRIFRLDTSYNVVAFKKIYKLVYKADKKHVRDIIIESLRSEKQFEMEFRVVSSDNKIIYIKSQGEFVYDDYGYKLVGIVMDITDQKINKEFLELMQYALDNVEEATYLVDDRSRILYANSGAVKQVGYTKEELQNMNAYDIRSERYKDSWQDQWSELKSNQNIMFEIIHRSKDNREFPVEVSANLIKFADKYYSLSMVRDISKRKKIESELIEARDRADKANKAKSNFLANMSHEIRTPMNAIIGMSYLLLESDLKPEQRNYITKLSHASESLMSIINDILDFSKIEAGKMVLENIKFNLDDILVNISNVITIKSQEKGIELIFDIADDVPEHLVGDPLRLQQVLINLFSNAVKFTTGENKSIILYINVVREDKNDISLKFCVQDSGIGMSEDEIKHLFEVFTQADGSTTRRFGGTGLGLSICKKIVNLMSGNIWVKSQKDIGSKFYFEVPLKLNPQEEICCIDDKPTKELNVLIVEDNKISKKILENMIKIRGWHVSSAENSDEAIELIKEYDKREPFDVVLMDWKLKGKDGIDTTKIITHELDIDNVPNVILVTAYNFDELIINKNSIGVSAFLNKPIIKNQLISTIYDVVENMQNLDANNISNTIADELSSIKILVVEDNDINQLLVENLLKSKNIKPTIVSNGKEAIDILSNKSFDIILMDCQMPIMDGYQATEYIRNTLKLDTPVIALSANAYEDDLKKAKKYGMNDYIVKPIDVEHFFEVISRWIGSNTHILDYERGIALVNNNEAFYKEIIEKFILKMQEFIVDFDKYIKNYDTDSAKKIVHTIKGTSGTIGATGIYNTSIELEKACMDNDIKSIDKFFENIKYEFELLKNESKNLSSTNEDDNEEYIKRPKEDIKELIKKLKNKLDGFDLEALEIVNALKYVDGIKEYNIDIESIESYIKKYDFEQAKKIVDTIDLSTLDL